MSFYPLRVSGSGQVIRFFVSQTANPTMGQTGLVPADFNVDWCDVGASSFTGIDSDGGGTATTIDELGNGWYEYDVDVSRVGNAGVAIFYFTPDGGIPATVKCFVGAGAASGRLSVRVDDLSSAIQNALADAIWDEDLTGHTTADTGGGRLDAKVTSRLAPTVAARTLDVSAGGEAGVDWANVGSPTTTVNLSGTTVKTATDVETDTQDIQSRLPAALTFGKMESNVGSYSSGQVPLQPTTAGRTLDVSATGEAGIDWANIGSPTSTVNLSGTSTKAVEPLVAGRALSVSATNAVTVGTIENNKITAAAIATDAIGAAQLAADAVTEIQSGLATASALATVAGFVDTEVATVVAGVADIQSRIPAALSGGNIKASVEAYASGLTPLQPTVAGRTLDVSAGGEAGLDWANIGSKTTTNALTNTTIDTGSLASDVADGVLDAVVEGSMSLGDAVRLLLGVIVGKVSDFETGVLVFKDPSTGAKTRATITTDDSGRLSVALGDLTA